MYCPSIRLEGLRNITGKLFPPSDVGWWSLMECEAAGVILYAFWHKVGFYQFATDFIQKIRLIIEHLTVYISEIVINCWMPGHDVRLQLSWKTLEMCSNSELDFGVTYSLKIGRTPVARRLPTQDNTTQKDSDKHSGLELNSNPRYQCWSGLRLYAL